VRVGFESLPARTSRGEHLASREVVDEGGIRKDQSRAVSEANEHVWTWFESLPARCTAASNIASGSAVLREDSNQGTDPAE